MVECLRLTEIQSAGFSLHHGPVHHRHFDVLRRQSHCDVEIVENLNAPSHLEFTSPLLFRPS